MWMQKFIRLYKSLVSKAFNHVFGRWEEGTVLGNIEARLTRNFSECILYFYGKIWGILENVPRFLKNAFHIPEEHHLGFKLGISATLFAYGNMIRYDPTLMDLTSNFFVLCTNVIFFLYNYS